MIRASLRNYRKNNTNVQDDDLVEWTLEQVLTTIEPSVMEIGHLRNDSFSRFRRQRPKQINKLIS